MPPAKRSLPKKEEVKTKTKIPTICYCSKCGNRGDLAYENIYKCKEGINAPFGNHSVINCLKYI
jgi:hypothetical protein